MTRRGRPTKPLDIKHIFKAAELFYEKEWPKHKIASALNTNVRGVTRLLEAARASKQVRIILTRPASYNDLDQQVQAKHPHLDKVLILEGNADKGLQTATQLRDARRKWGFMAAEYFEEVLSEARGKPLHVGISGGEGLLQMCAAVPELERPNVHVHAMAVMGHGPSPDTSILPMVNAAILWSRCGRAPGRCSFLTVTPYEIAKPGLLDMSVRDARAAVRRMVDELAGSAPIKEFMAAMNDVDVAFVSLHPVEPPPPEASKKKAASFLQSPAICQALVDEGVMANFAGTFIDSDGRSLEKWRFILAAGHGSRHQGIDFFSDMVRAGKKVVLIAGSDKLPALQAALKAEALNVLITDTFTATALANGN